MILRPVAPAKCRPGLVPYFEDYTDLTGFLNGRIGATRASSKWIFNDDSELVEITTDAMAAHANADHDPSTGAVRGWLIEEQRVNILERSEEFGNVYWGAISATISSNSTTGPDGLTTADTITETAGTGLLPRLPRNVTIVSSTIYTLSIFAKETGGAKRYLQLYFNAGFPGASNGANFDLATGTATLVSAGWTATTQALPDGWYRCRITSPASTGTVSSFRIALQESSTAAMAAGWNPSGAGSMYLWGAQLEAGSLATSYVQTVASTATRARDISIITNLSAINFSATAGSVLWQGAFVGINPGVTNVLWCFDDAGYNNRINLIYEYTTNKLCFEIYAGGVLQGLVQGVTPVAGTVYKVAVSWANNSMRLSINGTGYTEDTSATIPTVTQLEFSHRVSGEYGNAWHKRCGYLPYQLSQAQLNAWSA